ncbi:MAG: CPBP family intramembrane glutamic endopeptidase [bacterium]
MPKLELDSAGVIHDHVTYQVDETPVQDLSRTPSHPTALVHRVVALGCPLVAVACYFVAGRPLWAMAILAVLSLAGYLSPAWRQTMAFPRAVFAFLTLTFVINTLGIAYPYSNIFVLTGLLGLFSLSGMEWKSLYFGSGKTAKWTKTALLVALGLIGLILSVHFWQPTLLGNNPTPKDWPPDVILMMAIGYATFSALMEETIFRGVLIAYGRACFRMEIAVVAQALIFAMMHYRVGFPMHATGAALALFWGFGAGWLVTRAESIYPAFLMHFVLVLILFLVLAFA